MGNTGRGIRVLHRLDPRVKICAVMALSLLIFAAAPAGIALISLFLLALIRTARLTLAQTAAALRPVAIFMAVIFLMHLFTTEGRPLFTLFALSRSRSPGKGSRRGL